MKNSLLSLSVITLFFLFSCINPQKTNQIESQKKDSIYWAEQEVKAFIHADSIFTGFMDLKWNSSKKEAIKYVKNSKDLKIESIGDDDIFINGSFAGSDVKFISLTYYNDKLFKAYIDFGYKPVVFYETLIEKLELKYGKAYKSDKVCAWNFGISNSKKNRPQIYLSNNNEGVGLSYSSKYYDEYKLEKKQLEDKKEKSSIKLKDL